MHSLINFALLVSEKYSYIPITFQQYTTKVIFVALSTAHEYRFDDENRANYRLYNSPSLHIAMHHCNDCNDNVNTDISQLKMQPSQFITWLKYGNTIN